MSKIWKKIKAICDIELGKTDLKPAKKILWSILGITAIIIFAMGLDSYLATMVIFWFTGTGIAAYSIESNEDKLWALVRQQQVLIDLQKKIMEILKGNIIIKLSTSQE